MLTLPEQLPPAGQFKNWHHLFGAGKALALAELSEREQRPVVVICHDNQSLARLTRELNFFLENKPGRLITLPDRETLPYDQFSPHQDILSDRIATLANLPKLQNGLVIAAVSTLLTRLPPVGHIGLQALSLQRGQKINISQLRRQLESSGYRAVESVYEHGEFAVRGAIIDLYPMGHTSPVRLELFDDDIDTLRHFDTETQRSTLSLDELRLLPAQECPLDKASVQRFRTRWEEFFDVDPRTCPIYQDVINGIHSPGLEYFLPLFFERTDSFFDYLPATSLLISDGDLLHPLRHYWQEIERRHDELKHDHRHPLLPPSAVFIPENEFFAAFNPWPRIRLMDGTDLSAPGYDFKQQASPELPVQPRESDPLAQLRQHLAQHPGRRALITVESAGRRESLREQMQRSGMQPAYSESWKDFIHTSHALSLTLGELEQGVQLGDVEIIAEAQLFGARVMQRRRRRHSNQDFHEELALRSLGEMTPGAPVVHIDHGVGRYQGLVTLEVEGQTQEFVLMTYADEAKLYVPVAQLHLIARYAGQNDEHAPLHRLGTDQWLKARKQSAEKIHDVAAELLDIYARRAARPGLACRLDGIDYETFAAGFPFEETADQAAAITATLADMASPRPMDRLVCGDVGFGKTEVAMRAAFVAVQNNLQVAILVPTTLLAQQHYETFRDRFADWPVRIEVLSRFRSAQEVKSSLEALAQGKLDIVIGTHKLLQPDVKFYNLGLMIVDEEHRFGVKHKETLKHMRAEVDMLTLTATPIPRTLNMALSSLRDLSIIATPPARRLAIRTFVREHQPALVKEAILRELLRGGQVYYLHNEVESIDRCQRELASWIPEARLGIAHGQMRERELEQIMQQFYHKQFNVLVCTTIIETGIDVPSANTIIIDRADKLGLAQLHQLRGRVGRSHHQAYAYLLTPPEKKMTPDAQKRLDALELAQDLGSGFVLASQDLEIRGAGELLGDEQSGGMQALGYSMYMEMLERAVKAIQEGRTPLAEEPLALHSDINLRIPALIPDDYLPDIQLRLMMYKRIASTREIGLLQDLKVEMIDRFGLLPPSAQHLFAVQEIQIQAHQMGINRLDASAEQGRLEFSPQTRVNPASLIRLIQSAPRRYKLEGSTRLRFSMEMATPQQRIEQVRNLLDTLSKPS